VKRAEYLSALVGAVAFAAHAVSAGTPAVAAQDFMVPALDAGIELHLRNQRPLKAESFAAGKVVLFVHGATFPSTVAFDFDMPGGSWMKFMAARGFDVYALDIRGYGGSTRPPAMAQEPASNPPFADTREATRDIAAAVDFILKRRGVRQLVLIGWSWGTTTTAAYAAEHPDKVGKLVLVSPVWLPMTAQKFTGAYRTGTHDSARALMIRGIPPERVEEVSPQAQFDLWWAATLATDPEGARRTPPVLRSPNGVFKDFLEIWAAGNSAYDPARIHAPTLLIVGEWDAITPPAMALQLFEKLTNAAQRRVVLLAEGTHFIALEKNRMHLIHEVQGFLEEEH
jgi:pimeloyl-ACP methyl ester carboxylesterase